jgi:hypothetical protein
VLLLKNIQCIAENMPASLAYEKQKVREISAARGVSKCNVSAEIHTKTL